MAKCVPGMPCYDNSVIVYTTYPAGCQTEVPGPFTLPLSSDDVYYSGPNLSYAGINNTDSLTISLQKIDAKLSPTELINLIITAIQGDPVLRTALCTALSC